MNFFDDIYALGCGYKKAFRDVGSFFAKCSGKIIKKIVWFFVVIFKYVSDVSGRYFRAVRREFRKFISEVRRALPILKSDFKDNPVKAFAHFIRYIFRAFVVHKRFSSAVVSTVIPIVAAVIMFSFWVSFGSLTFALDVGVNGESVGIVKDEKAYKEAEKQAKQRFAAMGSEMKASVPEYTVVITTANKLDGNETVCNNIISYLFRPC